VCNLDLMDVTQEWRLNSPNTRQEWTVKGFISGQMLFVTAGIRYPTPTHAQKPKFLWVRGSHTVIIEFLCVSRGLQTGKAVCEVHIRGVRGKPVCMSDTHTGEQTHTQHNTHTTNTHAHATLAQHIHTTHTHRHTTQTHNAHTKHTQHTHNTHTHTRTHTTHTDTQHTHTHTAHTRNTHTRNTHTRHAHRRHTLTQHTHTQHTQHTHSQNTHTTHTTHTQHT